MSCKELEFRGIPLSHLGMYFEELGAKKITNSFPYLYTAPTWSAVLLNEEHIKIASNFFVNSVQVRFEAENEEIMENAIKRYRSKTTRVGG